MGGFGPHPPHGVMCAVETRHVVPRPVLGEFSRVPRGLRTALERSSGSQTCAAEW